MGVSDGAHVTERMDVYAADGIRFMNGWVINEAKNDGEEVKKVDGQVIRIPGTGQEGMDKYHRSLPYQASGNE